MLMGMKFSLKKFKEMLWKNCSKLKKLSKEKIDEKQVKDKQFLKTLKKCYENQKARLKKDPLVKFADKNSKKSQLISGQKYRKLLGNFDSSLELLKSLYKGFIKKHLNENPVEKQEIGSAISVLQEYTDLIYNFANYFYNEFQFNKKFKQFNNELVEFEDNNQENYDKAIDKLNNIIENKKDKISKIEAYLKSGLEIKTRYLKEYNDLFLKEYPNIKVFIDTQGYLNENHYRNYLKKSPKEFTNGARKSLILINKNSTSKLERKNSISETIKEANNSIEIIKEIIEKTNDFSKKLEQIIDNAYKEYEEKENYLDSLDGVSSLFKNSGVKQRVQMFEEIEKKQNSSPSSSRRSPGKLGK